ncbi:MAG: hypothetical protein HGA87_05665 [Desulfobulbaceae bacterium]|nr:hypothetical protein [Desulfobulbaceae bacterium]
MKTEVVVTGYGISSPLGNSIPEFEKRMFAGESGIIDIRGILVPENFPVPFGGVIDDSDIPLNDAFGIGPGTHSPGGRYLLFALEQFLETFPESIEIDGIVFATPAGIYFDIVYESLKRYKPDDFLWDEMRAEWREADVFNELLTRFLQSVP